ncbi:MAG: choice-of-anchor D domain-containing protein, partial [Verrucomicrobiales bacterium]|nr:choice-of-anchor D domain-containing protein [Verrucomicrobiales bacterium]
MRAFFVLAISFGLLSKAYTQQNLYEDTFNGGVVGGGYSLGIDTSGTGNFSVSIPTGSTIRQAYLLAGRVGPAPDLTLTLNGTPFTFNSSNAFTGPFQTNYGGDSAVHAIDVTASISPATTAYTIVAPTQSSVSNKYVEFYLYIAFNNAALPSVTSAVFCNDADLNVITKSWTLNTTTPILTANPVGFAVFGGYAGSSTDSEKVTVNGTDLGSFYGPDFNAAGAYGAMAGFQYYNNTLTGYGDDNADQVIFGPDALSNIQAVIPNATTSIPVIFRNNANQIDNHIWTVFLTSSGSAVSSSPEIAVSGNSVDITNGDAAPSLADHTDFDSTAAAGGAVARTFTITNSGTGDLTLTGTAPDYVTLSGTGASHFSVTAQPTSATVASGGGT